ncbi:MAG: DUF3109 family protein [Sediminibacterium sp.]|nr:DUF3109 family protein [Sediminibacterium sp.]TXT33946.1 MAG: hypothetical protein FD136_588 [Chitinophagaceae bacterium]
MIAIDHVLVSDEVIEEQFVCDLNKCKGGCCEDGDAGAPMEMWELKKLDEFYEVIKPYMTKEGIAEVKRSGKYVFDQEFGWVTPTIDGAICAYGLKDEMGIIKCGIEQAYNDGKLDWKKPVSCHLFPILVKKSKRDPDVEYVNYQPREDLCKCGCNLGKKLKVPVYEFLKEALIRKYGEEFYNTLSATAAHMNKK